jgi:hypothetical protein
MAMASAMAILEASRLLLSLPLGALHRGEIDLVARIRPVPRELCKSVIYAGSRRFNVLPDYKQRRLTGLLFRERPGLPRRDRFRPRADLPDWKQ